MTVAFTETEGRKNLRATGGDSGDCLRSGQTSRKPGERRHRAKNSTFGRDAGDCGAVVRNFRCGT